MTSRDFCFWLQGYFELAYTNGEAIPFSQAKLIRAHLNLVFAHEIDPSMGGQNHQAALNSIHGDKSKMRC